MTSKTESILFFFPLKENVYFFLAFCIFSNRLQLSAVQMELINVVVFKPHGRSLTMCFMGGYRDPATTIMMSIRSL